MPMLEFSLRTRPQNSGVLCVNAAGHFFRASPEFAERRERGFLTEGDRQFLLAAGHAAESTEDLTFLSHSYALAARQTAPLDLDYLILVPTLRCNLRCSYCQVSRADENAVGHDWSEATCAAVLALIDSLSATSIKIEFQGGEPTLRPDLLQAVIDSCDRFADKRFVICTNLSRIDAATLAIFDRPDVFISTSLDGDIATHQRNRTQTDAATEGFGRNLDFVLARYGPGKLSALPTIDPINPPAITTLIANFADRGLTSIFLRPINFHGFARKQHRDTRQLADSWRDYYERFIMALIVGNWADRSRVLEESYFSLCLRRIFRPGQDRHVDLRNPNPIGTDYIVVDYDGTVYPTDEARMLTRSGVIDLAIGDVQHGWDGEVRRTLDAHATNLGDPDCDRCAYQPFCGRDLIDDLARYGRIDLPRPDTEFCRRHLHAFDLAFRLIYSDEPAVRYSLARWLAVPGEYLPLSPTHHDPANFSG